VTAAALTILGPSVAALSIDAEPAGASVIFNVTTTIDEHNTGGTSCVSANGCSLRAAVEAANAVGGAGITLAPGATYQLTLGSLNIGTAINQVFTITGNNAIIQAKQPVTCPATPGTCNVVLDLDPNVLGQETFAINNVTITGGETNSIGGAGVQGGADLDVYSFSGDTFSNNTILGPPVGGEADGAGVSIGQASTVTVSDCTFSGNSSGTGASGGGLFAGALDHQTMNVTVTNSVFNGNSDANPTGGGGGIYFSGADTASVFNVSGSSFVSNSATSGGGIADGGGAILIDGTGTLNAFSNNFDSNLVSGTGRGGAINVDQGTANLHGNVFHANTDSVSLGQALAADQLNSPSVDATDNWWASNSAPTTLTAVNATVTPYLQLRVAALTNPVLAGGSTTVAADLTHDQSNVLYNAHLVPNGFPVIFGGSAGTYGAPLATLASGAASSTMTAGPGGDYTPNGVTATVDGFTAGAEEVVDQAPAITTGNAATFVAGTLGSFEVDTTGYPTGPTLAITETGALPGGVSLIDNGDGTATLTGIPAGGSGGTYPITIFANNGVSPQATQDFTLNVDETPSFTSAASASFTVGTHGTATVSATGRPGGSSITYTDPGATLPAGVSFTDNGDGTATIAGTPQPGSAGLYSFTIDASNGVGAPTSQNFDLTVSAKSQSISFTSTKPSAAIMSGPTYTPTATATSGLPVTITVEPGSLAVCRIVSGAVLFYGRGTCTLDANQSGNVDFLPAVQVTQSFLVAAPASSTVLINPFGWNSSALTAHMQMQITLMAFFIKGAGFTKVDLTGFVNAPLTGTLALDRALSVETYLKSQLSLLGYAGVTYTAAGKAAVGADNLGNALNKRVTAVLH
jgi:hypothetical protein